MTESIAPLTTRLFLARHTITLILATMHAIDWCIIHFEREDDVPEFLRDEYRPMQIAGRPRKQV